MSLFKRSTRDIVTGRRPKNIAVDENVEPIDPAAEEDAEGLKTVPSKSIDFGRSRVWLKRIPTWTIYGAIVLVIVALAVALLAIRGSTSAVSGDLQVIALDADPALVGYASAGDVVGLYTADGSAVESLQYVQVCRAEEHGQLLLLVDAGQAADILQASTALKAVLVVHDNAGRAAELLDLQARINDPVITLVLESSCNAAPGEKIQLNYKVSINPEEASVPEIEWISSDPEIVAVTDGIITGSKVGQATITASCAGKTAECVVTVEIPLERLELAQEQVVLGLDETVQLKAAPVPEDATHCEMTWSSDDPDVAIVSQEGVVTGMASGTTIITVRSGSSTAQCSVTVGVHAQIVQLDKPLVNLQVGQQDSLKATIYPGTDVIDERIFESSDPAVATVDADGMITAIGAGTATITFHCGEAAATCTVTVENPGTE